MTSSQPLGCVNDTKNQICMCGGVGAVIVNQFGDMIVRPSYVEFAASQSLPFQGRVQEHYLASYQASFIAICSAQYGDKAFKGGMEVNPLPPPPPLSPAPGLSQGSPCTRQYTDWGNQGTYIKE